MELKITNPKIVNFFNKQKNVNMEEVLLWMISLFEKVTSNPEDDMKSIQEILRNVKTLNNKLESKETNEQGLANMLDMKLLNMATQMQSLKDDIANNVLARMTDNRTEYMAQIKSIMNETTTKYESNTSSTMEKCNGQLLEKLQNNFMKMQSDEIQKIVTPMLSTIQSKLDGTCSTLSSIDTTQQDLMKIYKGSKTRGNMGERILTSKLGYIYPGAEIDEVSTTASSCDIKLTRKDKESILFENKDYTTSVDKNEVKKFLYDIERMKCHGILISQASPITGKDDYQIDYHNGYVLVYIHFGNYSEEKIRTAVSIIENLSMKLKDINENKNEGNVISDDDMMEINNDYRFFLEQKNELLLTCNEFNTKIKSQIQSIEMKTLNKFLGTKYATEKNTDFFCEACNMSFKNARALKAHQRGTKCKLAKKDDEIQNIIVKT